MEVQNGRLLLSKTAVSQLGERLWEDYQAFAQRKLSEYEITYLFVDGIAEVVHEAGDRAVVSAAIVGNDPGSKLARNGPARRLIGRLRPDLEFRPHIFRHLGRQVAHAMRSDLPMFELGDFDRLPSFGGFT